MAVADLVEAANSGVTAGEYKPHNCHEAALGWVLRAKYPALRVPGPLTKGAARAWHTLRSMSERYGTGMPKQLTGQWMANNIYNRGYTLVRPTAGRPGQSPFSHATFLVGDVVFMGDRNMPHHSMVVVAKTGPQVLARGFNNAGAFGGPYMGWDPQLRDLADMTRWDAQGRLMGNNGPAELYTITYQAMCNNIPDDLNF